MQRPLRVGVVGLGWAGEQHIKAYVLAPNVELVAVVDPRAAVAERLAAAYNVPRTYADADAMLAAEDLDIVSVCTPNHLHMPVTLAAFARGAHVLCEKPLARTVEEAQAMVDGARAANRVLHIAFNHRQRGDVMVLKRAIDDGMLGRIYHAKATWMRRNGIPGMGGWFTTREMAGGGPLIDLGVHVLDMALHLMGEPEAEAVSAMTYNELGGRGRGGRGDTVGASTFDVEDLATAFVRLRGGHTLLLEASWAAYRPNNDSFGVSLFGTEGGAELAIQNYTPDNTLRLFMDVGGAPAEVHPQVTRGLGHQAVVDNFLATIAAGDYATHDGSEGLRRTQIIEACYRSATLGREVTLAEITQPAQPA